MDEPAAAPLPPSASTSTLAERASSRGWWRDSSGGGLAPEARAEPMRGGPATMTGSERGGERQPTPSAVAGLSLGVIITNYNTWELTRRCLDAIFAHGEGVDRVLVLDDASDQAPPVDFDPRVEVEVNERNLGLVKTLNRAVELVGTDLVVVFDSDAYPLTGFAGPVRSAFTADPALALAGFRTVDEAGRRTASSEPEPDVLGLVLGQRLDAWRRRLTGGGGAQARRSIYSCAMALRCTAFFQLGGFDEEFDWLDLDHDLSMRMHRSPWRLARLPEVVAFHRGSGAPQAAGERVLRHYKNRWLLLAKHGKLRHPALVRRLVLARLGLELAGLRLAGRLFFGAAAAAKVEGRRRVLSHCREHYFPPGKMRPRPPTAA